MKHRKRKVIGTYNYFNTETKIYSVPKSDPLSKLSGAYVETKISNGSAQRHRITNVGTDFSGNIFRFIFTDRNIEEVNATLSILKQLQYKYNETIPLDNLYQPYIICLDYNGFEELNIFTKQGKLIRRYSNKY
jgi:hypothetical protein